MCSIEMKQLWDDGRQKTVNNVSDLLGPAHKSRAKYLPDIMEKK